MSQFTFAAKTPTSTTIDTQTETAVDTPAATAEGEVVGAPAGTAARTHRRGRPAGTFKPRAKTFKFSLDEWVSELLEAANTKVHLEWAWYGRTYPKTKRSHGPSQYSQYRVL